MIVLGAILLILGYLVRHLDPDLHRRRAARHRCGVLDPRVRRPRRSAAGELVLALSRRYRPAEVSAATVIARKTAPRAGLGRPISLLRASRCAASSSAGRTPRAPSAAHRSRRVAGRSRRSTSTQISTYCRCALRTWRLRGARQMPRSRSWMRIRSDSPSAKSRWKSIKPVQRRRGVAARRRRPRVAPASSRVLIPTSSSTSSASLLGKCR